MKRGVPVTTVMSFASANATILLMIDPAYNSL
jgi:hypothetical protein